MGESDQANDGLCGRDRGLITLSPLFAATAILEKLGFTGPVFVALDRITMGKKFKMYKFRSMVDHAHEMKDQLAALNERKDGGPLFKMQNDPRGRASGKFCAQRALTNCRSFLTW